MEGLEGLPTPAACDFAGLNRVNFADAHKRGLIPWAPATVNGIARVFDTDELIAAFCLGQLLERLITPRYAYQIATDIHRLVHRDHMICRLSAWKVTGRNGKPRVTVSEAAPSAKAIELLRFQIDDIRLLIIEGKREWLRSRSK